MKSKEDEIALFLQDLKDIQSGLHLIQIAVNNDFDQPTLGEVGNSLEIILAKYKKVMEIADNLLE